MGSLGADSAKKRSEVVEWLNSLFPEFNMSVEASDDELKARLFDGTLLCSILNKLNPSTYEENRLAEYLSSEHRLVKIKRFLLAIEDIGLPNFKASDLEQGSIASVVSCLLALRDHFRDASVMAKFGSSRCRLPEGDRLEPINAPRGDLAQLDSRLQQRVLRSPIMSEPSSPSTAMLHHVGHKFHEVFQLKQGHYSDLPASKISEMMKSNSLDNAPTQSLLSVVNGILDESIDRKNGEIPHRVACLLRKVVQEIERRISTQAEHIRNQNNLIKAREEKYHSRIRALEALATGTNEESQVVTNQLQLIKTEKTKIEEIKKLGEQDMAKLMKEKECSDNIILELKQELEATKRSYQEQLQQLGSKADESKLELKKKIQEAEALLAGSRLQIKELEASSESKFENWNKKQYVLSNLVAAQLQSVQIGFESIRNEVASSQRKWCDEFASLGVKLKLLVDAAESYHAVLAENRKLYNEVQELKGNIRVYCRIRPFLPGQNKKATTVEYIGENGELLVVNPSKPGKEGNRMFKFNKVFGPKSTQEEVYLDTQPLIRSILDGYNVCIFAYGQTGSGKTYTMWAKFYIKRGLGVNYRALNDLFHISNTRRNTFMYEVGVQMVEIYNEQVRDLLANGGQPKKLGIWSTSQPNGLAVPDATMLPVNSTSDVINFMQIGLANRAVSATALNERSSRSHCILTVHVHGMDLKTGTTTRGSLHLVDLAGSERVDRSEVTGDRLKEAQHINKSLSALGDVIYSLSQKSQHVPYRNSKLTQLLQTSLGGQAKTLMFVQINPDVESYSETLSTLKFAERVSGVELGAARSNKEGKDIKHLMEQVASLKDTIARKDEEIEHLQLLKDTPSSNEKIAGNLRHSASAPGITTQQGRKLLGVKVVKPNVKATSEPDSYSDHSDRHSEAGSQQSLDEFKHQRDNLGQSKLSEDDASQNISGDAELLGFGDADSEERLSDISDGGLSMGTETDGSIGSVVEYTLFPESAKSNKVKKEKTLKDLSKATKRVPQKIGQTSSVRSKLNNPVKTTTSIKKTTSSQTTASPLKSASAKHWQ